MKKFLVLVISLMLFVGCGPSTSSSSQSSSTKNVTEIRESNRHNFVIKNEWGTTQIQKAKVIGVDRYDYLIQRFDYEGNTYILYKETIIQVNK